MAAGQRGAEETSRLIGDALAADRLTTPLVRRLYRVAHLLSGVDDIDHVVDPEDPRIDSLCLAADRLREFADHRRMALTVEACSAAMKPAD
jgi:hypothetical protein